MPDRRRRATATRVGGRRRATYLAGRVGLGLRECRTALRLTQARAADRAGVSQPFWSRLERGLTAAVSLETLAACAAAVDAQLAAFIEARPGSELPRDIEHLRRQERVLRIARPGGWTGRPERPIDPAWSRSRSIDVLLERTVDGRHEVVVVEIEDWLADIGAVMRGLDDKVAAIRRETPGAAVRGVLLVRQTSRNRDLMAELEDLVAARFAAPGAAWMRALADPSGPLPDADGWLWTSAGGDRISAPRRSRRPRPPARAG
jgi:transcriptional regulator with XRE-family HTH domain